MSRPDDATVGTCADRAGRGADRVRSGKVPEVV